MIRLIFATAFVVGAVALFAGETEAQVKTRLRFPAGASSTAVKGTIRGYAYRDYIVRANADQTFTTSVTSANRYTILTIFRPDGDNLDGAAQMGDFSGTLPVTGDYVIRVGMMRAGARRPGAVSNFTLKVSID
jgi:hypothetical protein